MMAPSFFAAKALLRFGVGLPPGIKLERLAGFVGLYPFFMLMVYYSHTGSWAHFAAGASRSTESNADSDTFICLYLAGNIMQAIGQSQTESGVLLWQLMAHHALSIFCFGLGFYFDRFRFFCAFAGMCETTNLFLVPVFAAKEIPSIKVHTWYKVNGVLLWSTFMIYRGLLFPIWLYIWYQEAQPVDTHPIEKYLYPITVVLLLVLSGAWFVQIHKGVVKVMTPGYYEADGTHKGKDEKDF